MTAPHASAVTATSTPAASKAMSGRSNASDASQRSSAGVAVGPGDAVLPRDVDFGGAAPGWQFGQQGY